jgi:hypothetical protein
MELGAGLARARPLGMGVAQRHFLASTRPLRHVSLNHQNAQTNCRAREVGQGVFLMDS